MEKMRKTAVRLITLLLACALLTGLCSAAQPRMLVPVGQAVGLKLYAQGIMIVGFDEDGASPAERAGLQKGDVIVSIDGEQIHSLEQLSAHTSQGGSLSLVVERGGAQVQIPVEPVEEDGVYRLGAYVRDSISGIGTITFYDPESGCFGALGHGVNDLQTRRLLPIRDGSVVPAQVTQVQRGRSGAPGALRGSFAENASAGTIERNTDCGIFGTLAQAPKGSAIPVASPEQVKLGPASILSCVNGGEVRSYSVEICQLDLGESAGGRNLLLQVTDSELLEATGGIVQGMSGSPIIQEGRLIGAVTHVLVNDPTMGYGIFIENMLNAAA